MAPRDVDPHGDRLVGLVGDDDALADLLLPGHALARRASSAVARRGACLGLALARPVATLAALRARAPDASAWRSSGVRGAASLALAASARARSRSRPLLGGERPPAARRRRARRDRRLGRRVFGLSVSSCSVSRVLCRGLSHVDLTFAVGNRQRPSDVAHGGRFRPAVFSSSPVAGWKRSPNSSRPGGQDVTREARLSVRARTSDGLGSHRPLASRPPPNRSLWPASRMASRARAPPPRRARTSRARA